MDMVESHHIPDTQNGLPLELCYRLSPERSMRLTDTWERFAQGGPLAAAKDVSHNAWWATDGLYEDLSCFRGRIHVDSGTCMCSSSEDVFWNETICCPVNSAFNTIRGNCQCLYGFSMSEDDQCVGAAPHMIITPCTCYSTSFLIISLLVCGAFLIL